MVQATVTGGKVTGFIIVDPGYGYDYSKSPPSVTLSGGGGSGAAATASLTAPGSYNFLDGAGGWTHPLGVSSANKVITRPVIGKGDLGVLCLSFGSVSKRMVDHLAASYWNLERQMKAVNANTSNIDFREKTQAYSAYLMGMEYYRRVGDFRDLCARLHKNTSLSM